MNTLKYVLDVCAHVLCQKRLPSLPSIPSGVIASSPTIIINNALKGCLTSRSMDHPDVLPVDPKQELLRLRA